MKKLLLITSGDINKGSVRIRVLNYISLLEKEGWLVKVSPPIKNKRYSARLKEIISLLRFAENSDTVLIQKRLFPTWTTRMLKRYSKHLVFEFDDPIFLDNNGKVNPLRKQRLETMLKVADVVTVDNMGLLEYALEINPNAILIPSCVNTHIFKPLPKPMNINHFIIGWIGHSSNLSYIKEIEPAFSKLYAKYKDKIAFKVVSNDLFSTNAIPVINKIWKLEDEPYDIASFDVGIVPLSQNQWTKYKIAYRPYLFMSMEKPVVLSPAGPSSGILENGVEGFLAENPQEWFKALAMLIENPDLCYEMGKAGRRKVETNFTYEANLQKLLRVLDPSFSKQKIWRQVR